MNDVSRILEKAESGDPTAAEQLLPLVYDELRRLAARKLSQEQPGQTLQATALVHEAYVRLVKPDKPSQWKHRGHFFAAAAEAMRRILIERARQRLTLKRGAGLWRNELEDPQDAPNDHDERLLALNEALDLLERHDSVKARLVKLRYFVGLTNREAAEALDVSATTADRYWAYARAWLLAEMSH